MNLFTLDFFKKWENWLRLIVWTNCKISLWVESCLCFAKPSERTSPVPTGAQPESRLEEHLFTSLQGLLFTRLHISSLSSVGWAHRVFWSLTGSWTVCPLKNKKIKEKRHLSAELQLQLLAWIWNSQQTDNEIIHELTPIKKHVGREFPAPRRCSSVQLNSPSTGNRARTFPSPGKLLSTCLCMGWDGSSGEFCSSAWTAECLQCPHAGHAGWCSTAAASSLFWKSGKPKPGFGFQNQLLGKSSKCNFLSGVLPFTF